MRQALALARRAGGEGEVPVGCVIVRDGVVVGRGYNSREREQNALAHAELTAVAEACKAVGFWRLPDCAMYVTLEPCPMCAGAVINARVGELIYGASDPKAGACGSVIDLFAHPFNHKPLVTGGVLAEESSELLTGFFQKLREGKNDRDA
ncbi:MAG: tRNA adenosine(34) deaminase TadA [Oscillospiraceae bacterium]|jgi:tRNA(adenine34) deaminase|nr:tRNA adenosine(34) deaminase TadA [Oscillospiraceae bacterium]